MMFHVNDNCIGFVWQSSGRGWATGLASVRRREKLPTCPVEPVLAGFRTDLLLAKAKHISDGGSASGITYLRQGKKVTVQHRKFSQKEE